MRSVCKCGRMIDSSWGATSGTMLDGCTIQCYHCGAKSYRHKKHASRSKAEHVAVKLRQKHGKEFIVILCGGCDKWRVCLRNDPKK